MKKYFYSIIFILLFSCSDNSFEEGVDQLKIKQYGVANYHFNKIKESDPNFKQAQIYIFMIDSIQTAEKLLLEKVTREKADQDLKEMIDVISEDEIWKKGKKIWLDVNDLNTTRYYFDDLKNQGLRGLTSGDEEVRKKAKFILKNLPSVQTRDFPVIRKEYGRIVGKKLWRENIEVKIGGPKNSTITLIGAIFANNANIADFHKGITDMLTMFRFKRVEYKWVKSELEYTYYTLKSKEDKDIDYVE